MIEIGRVSQGLDSDPTVELAPPVDYAEVLLELRRALHGPGMIADAKGVPVNVKMAPWTHVVEAIHLFLKDKCPAISVRIATHGS
jgi:hypothetical protein